MLQFQMPNITREQLAGNRARFEVEPLDRGFGHTFGNALRRVLLSSLEGAAVASVKIEGAAHEFSTIKGVKEDVTDVILNLKELVCRLHGELDDKLFLHRGVDLLALGSAQDLAGEVVVVD